MITRLTIQHYKSIEDLDLRLPELAVFVGPNGTGKSNLIDAVRLIRDAAVSGLDHAVSERHGIDSLRQWSPSKPYHVTLGVGVKIRLGAGSLSFTLASYRGSHVVRREEGIWIWEPGSDGIAYERDPEGQVKWLRRAEGDGDIYEDFSAEQPDELFLRQLEAREFRPLVDALASFEAYSIFPNVLRTPQKPSNDKWLTPTGENGFLATRTSSSGRMDGSLGLRVLGHHRRAASSALSFWRSRSE